MKRAITQAILLFYIILPGSKIIGQNFAPSQIRLARITYLTNNLDSLTRSFLKRGFRIKQGKRQPGGVFNNTILMQDGSEIILETTLSTDTIDWRKNALKKYGSHISGIAFEVDSINNLFSLLRNSQIPINLIDSIINRSYGTNRTYMSYVFALDSCLPLDVVFFSKDTSSLIHSPEFDSLSHHKNNVFRIDWVLLSASPLIENRLRKFFEVIGALRQHQGCCDFWRVGPADDFCFFRFEPPLPKVRGINNWLSVEPDNIYFAY